MVSKLYVTNLSASETLASVRQRFTECGKVVDVAFLTERNTGATSAAYVTMATGASALKAVHALHGSVLHDRILLVALAPGSNPSARIAEPKVDAAPGARITQQYRDRHGLSYELDSAGSRLTLTFMFPDHQGAAWRVRAAIMGEQLGYVEASAESRELALTALGELCGDSSTSLLAGILWLDVAGALRAVRAI